MALPNGKYRTKAGSTVEISGAHSGISHVLFDWLEEQDSCYDCDPDPYPQDWGDGTHHLVWCCEKCGGGSAALEPVPEECSGSNDQ